MTTDAAFLDAIRAEPDEDVHRLAYADWLMERDDPRGEFIRVQCDLAKFKPRAKGRGVLAQREKELLAAHRVTWTDRAFVAWLDHPQERCTNPRGHEFCQAFAQGHAARCDLAALPKGRAGRSALKKVVAATDKRFADIGYVGGTKWLFANAVFRRGFVEETVVLDWAVIQFAEALFDLCVLRVLKVNYAEDHTDAAMRALLRVGARPELSFLDFSGRPAAVESLEALVNAPVVDSLTRLGLLLPHVEEGAVAALARAPRLTKLRRLDMSCDGTSDAMLETILDSPYLAGLTELQFDDGDPSTFSPPLLRRARKRFGRTTQGSPGLLFTGK